MANEMTYMKSAIPQEVGRRTKVKTEWLGLNESNTLNTGELCEEKNISADAYPYLMPCEKPVVWGTDHYMPYATKKGINFKYNGKAPYSIFSTGDMLMVLCNADVLLQAPISIEDLRKRAPDQTAVNVLSIILIEEKELMHQAPFLGKAYVEGATGAERIEYEKAEALYDEIKIGEGQLVPYNKIDNLDDIANGSFLRYQVMLPSFAQIDTEAVLCQNFENQEWRKDYKKKNWVEYDIKNLHTAEEVRFYRYTENGGEKFSNGNVYNFYPIKGIDVKAEKPEAFYGCSHLGRIFLGDGERIVATNYNSIGITLDDVDTYNESNGWNANLFSNTKSESGITAVYSYSGRVVVFKKDFMHEVYNTKNPFRVTDVCAVGCISQKSIAEIDGYLYFVSEDGVYRYNGESYPICISTNLKVKRWSSAVAGSFNHKYYLWGKDERNNQVFYIFDTRYGLWTKGEVFGDGCVGFAQTDFGFFALCNDGYIYRMDSGEYEGQEWSAETDLSTEGTVDTKHLRKVQMYADFTEGSSLKVTLITDRGEKEVFHYTADGDKKVPIRFSIRKSSSVGMRLRFDGVGKVKLYHMELEMTEGGERYVTG